MRYWAGGFCFTKNDGRHFVSTIIIPVHGGVFFYYKTLLVLRYSLGVMPTVLRNTLLK